MKINFFAPINQLGYGIHAYNMILEFERLGNTAVLIPPFGQVRMMNESVARWLENRKIFDKNNPGIMMFNEEYLTQFSGAVRIGFPVFEMEKFTELQIACMKSCDFILTPSEWGKEVLHGNGIKNVKVVPEGFSPEIFEFWWDSNTELNNEPFTFIHVGKYEERKGTIQVLRCFNEAMAGKDARLMMHVTNPFTNDYSGIQKFLEAKGFIKSIPGNIWRKAGLAIKFSPEVEFQEQLLDVYRQADFGIFPTKAEGWGLPILEAIASGIPCIVGNWTGQSEYLDYAEEMDPFIIKNFDLESANDGQWFKGDRGDWRVPDDSEIIDKMLNAFMNGRHFRKSEAWRKCSERIREKFTWKNSAMELQKAVGEICGVE